MDLLKKEHYKLFNILLAATSAATVGLLCYFLRNTVLACHDSMVDFTVARMHDFPYYFNSAMDFCLARGRVGVIFPFLVALKQLATSTSNFTLIWLIQQVPIWFNVSLITWIIARHTMPYYGFLFAAMFAALIQIDFNHSLMVCYPFDFMYGLTLMITGLLFYSNWLAHLKENNKTNTIRLIISLICYYESMQTYEPFITACFIYIFIAAVYGVRNKSADPGRSILDFILRLVPHGLVGSLFLGILFYLEKHPVSDTPVTKASDIGTLQGFFTTWTTYSITYLPLTHYRKVVVKVREIFAGKYQLGFAALLGMTAVFFFLCVLTDYRNKTKEERRHISKELALLGICGLILGCTYAIPHALTGNYQYWVMELESSGYVPSSICYFGWILALTAIGGLAANFFATKKAFLLIPAYIIATAGLATAAASTAVINQNYIGATGSTGSKISFKAQAFYACVSSDDIGTEGANIIYVPEFDGLHNDLSKSDIYSDYELGQDILLVNDPETLESSVTEGAVVAEFRYDDETDSGFYAVISNPDAPESEWITEEDMFFVSSYPESVTISYFDEFAGQTVEQAVDAGRISTYTIVNDGGIKLDSVKISQN